MTTMEADSESSTNGGAIVSPDDSTSSSNGGSSAGWSDEDEGDRSMKRRCATLEGAPAVVPAMPPEPGAPTAVRRECEADNR
jgi:hypothetical protein